MIFLLQGCILRFKPLIFRGVPYDVTLNINVQKYLLAEVIAWPKLLAWHSFLCPSSLPRRLCLGCVKGTVEFRFDEANRRR